MTSPRCEQCCIAVNKVPTDLPKEVVFKCVKESSNTSVSKWVVVNGAENDSSFEKLLLKLDSNTGVTKLHEDVRQAELEHDGEHYTLFFEKCIPCEIPLEWEDDDIEVDGDPDTPDTPKRSGNSQTPPTGPANVPPYLYISPDQGTLYQNQAMFNTAEGHNQPIMGQGQGAARPQFFPAFTPHMQFPFPFGMPQPNQQPVDGQNPEQQYQPQGFDPRMFQQYMQELQRFGQVPPSDGRLPENFKEPPPPYTSGEQQMFGIPNQIQHDSGTNVKWREADRKDFPQNQAVADQDEQLMKIQAKGKREEQANLPDMHGNASGRNQEEMVYEDQGEEEVGETTKLILKDLPDAAYPEFIQLFFEKKRFGKFDVLNVEMDKDQSMALVEFNDPEAVFKVLQQTPIEMAKTEIRVKPYFEVEEEDEPLCTVVVCGLLGLDEETIEMYFENRRAGGDEIEYLNLIEDGKALITYKSEEVAKRVVDKRKHVLNRQPLDVSLWQPPPKQTWNRLTPEPEPELGPADTIEVRGIGDSLDKETIAMYFENTKRSGGDDIKEMHIEEDVAFITYFSEEVAERVIDKGKHVLNKQELQVMIWRETMTNMPTPDCEFSPEPVSTVNIYGIDHSLDEETLGMYFENTKRSGGGDIENITVNYDEGVASITFKEVMVAERVAQMETHKLNRKSLHVTLDIPSSNRDAQSDPEPMCIVEVHGLSPSIDQETLELYFENNKRSGGNTIVNTDLQDDVAYIEYESEEVAQSVVKKGRHTLNKKELTVQIHIKQTKAQKPTPVKRSKPSKSQKSTDSMETGEEEEELTPTSVVKVKGVKKVTSLETMRYYFENTRRSDGGDIQEFLQHDEDDDIVFITFNEPDVAKKVASREHSVEDKTLHVSLHIPPKPRPFYEDKLLIRGLKSTTTKDCLFNFLEAKSRSVPIDLQRGEKEGVVLITFESEADYSKLTTVCGKTPLEGAMLQVSKVQVTNCIIVINIPQMTSKDTVWFYFENTRRSNGGPIDKVVMKEEDCSCLVYFQDYKVVDKVVAKKHVISDNDVIVKIFLECLGCPQGDISEMPFKLPDAVIISGVHQKVIKFMKNSDVNKKAMAMQMEAVNALVSWPKAETKSNDVSIECTLTQHMKGARMLAKSWKQVATKNFDDFMKNIVIESIMVSQEHWNDFMEKIKNVKITNPDGVAVLADREQCSVAIAGIKQIVEGVAKDIAFMVKQLEEEAEKEKERTKEQITNLKLIETKMLLAEKYPSKMETKYDGLKVKINQNKNEIVFEGQTGVIKSARCDMYEMKEKYATVTVDLTGSKSCFLLYDSKMAKDYIVKKLKTNHVTAVWEVRDQKLIVCSTSENTIDRSLELVKGSIVEQSISLTNENVDVVCSENWKAVLDEQNQKYPGKTAIEIQGNVAYVCGTDDVVSEVLGAVKKFLKTNTIVEDHVNFGKSINRLIEKDHKDDIATISKRCASLNTQVITKASNTGFTLRGTSEGVEQAKRVLEELSRKIQIRDHSLQSPGIRDHMTRKGQDHMQTIEQRHPVVFDTPQDKDEDNLYDEIPAMLNEGPRLHAFCIYDSRKIYAAEGDMTGLPVDVLVHAADSKLSLTGGLGKAMLAKGGNAIQDACKDYIRDEGELGEGEAFVSSAGKMKAKYIVHIVGPVWNDGTHSEESLLAESVLKSMKQATVKNVKSIAIPAISCGVYSFPLKRATRVIVESVKNFFREIQDSTIVEVYLCDVKSKTVDCFKEAMRNAFGAYNLKEITQRPSGRPTPKRGNRETQSYAPDASPDRDMPRFSTLQPGRGGVSFGKISVRVVKGEIAKQNVDVIVNTTARNLDLKNGAVSASLLREAGNRLQDEVSNKYPNGIKDGEIAVTSGQKLNCQNIIHTSLMNWDGKNNQAKKALHTLMNNCLNEADSNKFQSIAFPAIGTGNLGFPRDVVAREMFTVISNFSRDNRSTSIKDVRFIVYQKDYGTISAFDAEEKSRMSGGDGSPRNRQSRHDDPPYANFREVEASDSDSDRSGSYETVGSENEDGDEDTADGIRPLSVTVEKGDITQVKCDCIVNSSNENLDLTKGAVSQALLRRGGQQLRSECKTKAKTMKNDGIVMTEAPGFPFKSIIHVVAQDSTKTWKKMIDRCFQMADAMKLRSIAFPALGTNLQANANDIAEAMVNSLRDFEVKPHQYLQEVQFIIFQDHMVDIFKKAVEKTTKPKKSFLSTMLGYAGFGAIPKDSRKKVKKTNKGKDPKQGQSDSYPIRVYSMSKKSIDDAIENLEKIISNEVQRQLFKDDLLINLQDTQVKALMDEHSVNITFKSKTELEVVGMVQNVMKASNKIHSIIRQLAQIEQQKIEAKRVLRMVQWFFIDITEVKQELMKYEPTVNLLIENAFTKQQPKVAFSDSRGQKYIIDFDKMQEYPETDPSDCVNVIRRDLMKEGSFKTPDSWTDMGDENLKVVTLQNTDQEFQDIVKQFKTSVNSPNFDVSRVDRIQNKTLWMQYQAKKQLLDSTNKGVKNESMLWHGTVSDSVDSINANGFNRSYCGKNAVAFGDGVYFAVNAAYSCSDTYSRPDSSAVKRMYLCHVLTGEYTMGKSGIRVPPAKSGQAASSLYDSVVNNMASPTMFIIFHDTQAYPQYLIFFKKKG